MGQTLTYLKVRFNGLFIALAMLMLLPALTEAQVTVTVTGTNVTCFGLNNGYATAVGSGGWAPYTYLWSNGLTTQTIGGLAPGTYYVTVTDIDLGFGVGSITITQPPQLGVTVYGESQICGLVPDGKATAVPFGGTPPYTYLWSNGGTTAQITGLAGGTYTVTVTDANNCTASGSTVVYFWNEGIWIMDTNIDVTCFGLNNGSAHVSGMSGTPPYTYHWNTGSNSPDISNLAPGTYTVTVTDANGCSNTHNVDITQPPVLQLSASSTPGVCGLAGSATITVSGGTPPYTVLWSTGSTNTTITATAGTYTVTATDANGCTKSASATISVTPNSLLVNTSVLSSAGCTVGGSASVSASGGSGTYQYMWSGGLPMTSTVNNVPAGTYTVTVVDVTTGCTGTGTVNVPAAPALTGTATLVSNATCAIGGSATANPGGGTAPYTFHWDNNQTTQTATNLGAGPHSVTITDSKGCIIIAGVTIGQSQGPTVTTQVLTNATCVAGGSAKANATGGGGGYTYLWSFNNATTQTITNVPPGTYTVTVTDLAGCSAAASVTIGQPAGSPNAIISSSTGAGCISIGAATAGATGGTPPYTFKWSNGAMGAAISNLSPGAYTVTVTDGSGCTSTAVVSIAAGFPPNVVISASTNANCSTPGSATANASAGAGGPYTYLWNNGETTATAINLSAGPHTVTVTDALGCTATASVTIGSTNNGIKIGDYVWYDNDMNGFQDALETGVSGITVKLMKAGPDGLFGTADDILVSTTTTNGSGLYYFDCVTPGTYILMFNGIPAGYEWTDKDKVNNDCLDSDVKSNGKTDAFTIVAGQGDNLCYDAGIHTLCDNVTNAGSICCAQTICEGETPALLYGDVPPFGGSGPFEYQWMQLLQVGPAPATWMGIPGANSASYQPGALFETSYFMRCVRRAGCVTFLESNVIKITVKPAGSPDCSSFMNNFVVNPNFGNNAVEISWKTFPEPTQYLYVVQHSTDQQHWDAITTVMGKQNASGLNEYSAVDQTPANGTNFYRIKRASANGVDAFSEIRSIDMNISEAESVSIFPNPATDVLYVRNAIKYDTDVTVSVVSTNGRVLATVIIPQGTTQQLDLPMADLPQGLYLVRVNFGNKDIKTLKITKF